MWLDLLKKLGSEMANKYLVAGIINIQKNLSKNALGLFTAGN